MNKTLIFSVVILVLFLSLSISDKLTAYASDRTALVIGNSNYAVYPLKNPVNDATDMAVVLKQYGFDVALILNASHRKMKKAVRFFGKKLRQNNGAGLFYYSGHGIQLQGHNYLIPVGCTIESEGDVEFEAVDAGFVLAKMEDAGNDLNIVILDACRNNPFAKSFRSSSIGLVRMDAPKGTLIAYATAPGELAADGDGRNGPYTKHLIRNIQKPQITIEQVFKNVRVAVVSETVNKQVPWESSSLMGRFYFNPQLTGQSNIKQTSGKLQPPDNSDELLFWESIKNSKDPKRFEAYIEQFPNGMFSKLAKINIQEYSVTSIGSTDKKSKIIARDGQYIKYKNGIVYDKRTGLEWLVGPDKDTNWKDAKNWVAGLKLDGGGWRMPSIKELRSIYRKGTGSRNMTSLFENTGWNVWSGQEPVDYRFMLPNPGIGCPYFYFNGGGDTPGLISNSRKYRSFAVRFRR